MANQARWKKKGEITLWINRFQRMYKTQQPSYKINFHQHLIQFHNQKIHNQKVNYYTKYNTVLDICTRKKFRVIVAISRQLHRLIEFPVTFYQRKPQEI